MRRLTCLLAWLVCFAPAYAIGSSRTDTWMTMLLGGRKTGHMHIQRTTSPGRVATTKTIVIQFFRNGEPMTVTNIIGSVETDTGQPLAFNAVTRMSRTASHVDGKREADGRFLMHASVGGLTHVSRLAWPGDALLFEGQHLAMQVHGEAGDKHYRLQFFDPASRKVGHVRVEVIGPEQVDLPGGTQTLTHIREHLLLATTPQSMDLWLDNQYRIRKGSMMLLGQRLVMLACSKACAMAPNQDVDLLRQYMVDASRPLPITMRRAPMRYQMTISDGDKGIHLITTSEQHVAYQDGGVYVVDIGHPQSDGESPPTAADTAANDWVQSDAPRIRKLAQRVTRDDDTDLERIRDLKRFVRHTIHNKGLGTGYASALETLETHQGDCTEHAVLLAALARSLGIPTRIVVGMVYAERYAGRNRVFVPHEWVQAWINGRWRSYDPSLGKFDFTHIAFSLGDGNPWQFSSGMRMFGHIRINHAGSPFERMGAPGHSVSPGSTASSDAGGSPGGRGGN